MKKYIINSLGGVREVIEDLYPHFDEEEFNGRAHNLRSWPASDPKGASERYDELLDYVKKFINEDEENV